MEKKRTYSIFILVSIVLAVILGLWAPKIVNSIDFIGTIYINLLKFMIFPVIFSSIAVTIYNSKKIKSNILLKTILLFVIMFVISFLITSAMMLIIKPGLNYNYSIIKWSGEVTNFNYKDIIINLFPSNIVSLIEENKILATILLSLFIGLIANKVSNGEKVINLLDGIKNISSKILEYIMYITPLAIIALLGGAIANYGYMVFSTGAKYILMAYLCSLLVMIFVMILPVWIICKINPITYIKKIYKVWLITITTCSSVATLPTTIKICNEELGVDSNITNITVPLGCTIHMCGGAVSFAILGIFTCQLFDIDITITKYILMLVTSTLINMAAPGIPNGGVVIGASYLTMFNIPLSFIGFYSSIYKLLDMSYTTLNVTGDITANVIIQKYKK